MWACLLAIVICYMEYSDVKGMAKVREAQDVLSLVLFFFFNVV